MENIIFILKFKFYQMSALIDVFKIFNNHDIAAYDPFSGSAGRREYNEK